MCEVTGRSNWTASAWQEARLEPSLREIMSDPIVQAVMRRDGLTCQDVWRVIEAARRRTGTLQSSSISEKTYA